MSTTRIHATLRATIVDRLLAHRFDAEEAALKAEFVALGNAVHADLYKPATLKKLEGVPSEFLTFPESITVRFGNTLGRVNLPNEPKKPVEALGVFDALRDYPATHPLAERYAALSSRRSDLRLAKRTAQSQAELTVADCRTVEALLRRWPEVEPLLKGLDLIAKKAQPLALNTEQLNKTFALPVGTKPKKGAAK